MKIFLIASVVFICASLFADAQNQRNNLAVGDPAPEIKVYTWIKGGPITDFKKSKIYIVEFGATWCTPCAKAIPELSKIADENKDDVEVISLFVLAKASTKSMKTKLHRVLGYQTRSSQHRRTLSRSGEVSNGILNTLIPSTDLTRLPLPSLLPAT